MSKRRFFSTLLLPIAALIFPACLDRTLRIETTPPGARVIVDQKEVGTTPVDMSFTYGGVREIILLHEEDRDHIYKPIRVVEDTEVFHFDVFPFDFLTEIAPVQVHDVQVLHFNLEPSTLYDTVIADPDVYQKAILKRADDLRTRARTAQETKPDPFADDATDEEANPESRPTGELPASRPAESGPASSEKP